MLGKTLLASEGFTALMLFNLLRFPMMSLPETFGLIIRSRVSYKRIVRFLGTPTIAGVDRVSAPTNPKDILRFENVTLAWSVPPKDEVAEGKAQAGTSSTMCGRLSSAVKRLCSKVSPAPTSSSDASQGARKEAEGHRYSSLAADGAELDDGKDLEWSPATSPLHPRQVELLQLVERKQQGDASSSGVSDSAKLDGAEKPIVVLRNLTFSIPAGSLTAIVGSTGAGKSSLIAGLLGECKHLGGQIQMSPGVTMSLAPQTAWIQNASLRENILFGSAFDEDRYRQVLFACSLLVDLAQFPDGTSRELPCLAGFTYYHSILSLAIRYIVPLDIYLFLI